VDLHTRQSCNAGECGLTFTALDERWRLAQGFSVVESSSYGTSQTRQYAMSNSRQDERSEATQLGTPPASELPSLASAQRGPCRTPDTGDFLLPYQRIATAWPAKAIKPLRPSCKLLRLHERPVVAVSGSNPGCGAQDSVPHLQGEMAVTTTQTSGR
jgi:hypothetical protein